MKKTFLIAGFSVLNICSAQNFFELPKNGIICDVPGQTFFYSYLNGDALIVSEYDETGNILETDSVDVYVGSISNKVISLLPFGTSQEYLIIYRSILPSVVYTTSDTTLYTFVRYSGVTDQIEAVNNDTLINYFLHSESYNDTSVYLFEDHYFGYSGFQYPTNTLEVGPDLILDQIAPLDSIEKSYLANSYEFINDSFLVFQEVGQYSVALGSFAPDGSNYSEQDHILMPVADYNYIDFFSLVGQDSILLFYQGSNSGTYVNTWNFYLFDLQLNVINSSQTLSKNVFHPFWGEYLYYDRMSAEGVGVFQDKIYLLAHLTGDDSIKIFRYDLNFNLECDMTIEAYGNHFTGNFEIINGRFYYNYESGSTQSYFEISGCDFSLESTEEFNNEIELYPNPAESYFILDFPDAVPSSIIIYDNLGNIYLTFTGQSEEIKCDVSGFSTGLYLVEVIQANACQRKKLIIK